MLEQVYITASFDIAGNDNDDKEASKNHTLTETQHILDSLIKLRVDEGKTNMDGDKLY